MKRGEDRWIQPDLEAPLEVSVANQPPRKIIQVMKDDNDSYENHFGGSSILRNPPFHDVDG